MTAEPVTQTAPVSPASYSQLVSMFDWTHQIVPQPHTILVTCSLFFPLSFLILISLLPDEHGKSSIFSLCYSEQLQCPQPFAPNLLLYLRFHQRSQQNKRPQDIITSVHLWCEAFGQNLTILCFLLEGRDDRCGACGCHLHTHAHGINDRAQRQLQFPQHRVPDLVPADLVCCHEMKPSFPPTG